jgi:hypothetical protein
LAESPCSFLPLHFIVFIDCIEGGVNEIEGKNRIFGAKSRFFCVYRSGFNDFPAGFILFDKKRTLPPSPLTCTGMKNPQHKVGGLWIL